MSKLFSVLALSVSCAVERWEVMRFPSGASV